ncbi:MAG: hypothetical protein IJV59_09165, partial [Eubacterium sp.]|nr:hypothetical protein [Eubacterium sp.]
MKRKGWLCTLLAAVMVAMLVIVPNNVRAAEGDESDGSTSDNGMTITKTVDVNDDGTYNVNLEGFATGKVDFSEKTVPVDLILVLDVSGSMDGNINTYKYTARNRQGYTYNSYGNNTYYYKDGDNYYPVSRTRYYTQGSYSRVRALYYTKGSTTYYLSGTGTTTTAPSSPTNDGGTIWTGVLYTRSVDSTQKKIDALHTAVNGFIDVVADKNQEVL